MVYFKHIAIRKLYLKKAFIAVMVYVLTAPALNAQKISEYQVEAAFMFNFTKFVEWPASAFNNSTEPFVVGIVGNDPFGQYLREIIAGEKVMEHNIIIERYRDLSAVGKCHMLFVNLPGKTAEALNQLKDRSILTISDNENFAENGGMIQFYPENETIRLRTNVNAVKSANLNVSSKLLRIAKLYQE
jgi:hypothetical protein